MLGNMIRFSYMNGYSQNSLIIGIKVYRWTLFILKFQ